MPNIVKTNEREFPAGVIIPLAGLNIPAGTLLCEGQDVARSVYPDLFAAIGTIYGAGDGINTFGLPDLNEQFLRGQDDGAGVDLTTPGRALGSSQGHTAASPTTQINMSTQAAGSHTHTATLSTVGNHRHLLKWVGDNEGTAVAIAEGEFSSDGPTTDSRGAHTHAITGYSSEGHVHTVAFDDVGVTQPKALLMRSVITV